MGDALHAVADIIHVDGASTRQLRTEMLAQYLASTLHYSRRHYSGVRLSQPEAVLATLMKLRLIRDHVGYAFARDERRRRELAENLEVWRSALNGQ